MFLEGKNCHLRKIDLQDLPLLLKWRNRPHVVQNMEHQAPILWNEHFHWFYKIEREGYYYFIIETKENVPIGTIYISGKDIKNEVNSGLYIGDQRYLGTGISMEASKLIIDFAFNEVGVTAIKAKVNSNNQEIIRYNESLGFKKEETLKNKNGFVTMVLAR